MGNQTGDILLNEDLQKLLPVKEKDILEIEAAIESLKKVGLYVRLLIDPEKKTNKGTGLLIAPSPKSEKLFQAYTSKAIIEDFDLLFD